MSRPPKPQTEKRYPPRATPLILVNTGTAKGKSSSSFGVLMRAWGQHYRCGVYQFLKSGKWPLGERKAAELLSQADQGGTIDWFSCGDGWTWTSRDITETEDLAREGWAEVKRRIADESYEFLLLDEFTYPLHYGWIDMDEVIDVFKNRPGFQHIFITGRYAPDALIEVADLVTEMNPIKHPLAQGIKAQPGIEW